MALSIEPWPVMTIPSRSVSVSRAARRTSIPSPSGRWMSTIRRRGSNSSMARLASFTVPTERASPPRSLTDSSSPFRVARSSSTMRTFKPTPPEARDPTFGPSRDRQSVAGIGTQNGLDPLVEGKAFDGAGRSEQELSSSFEELESPCELGLRDLDRLRRILATREPAAGPFEVERDRRKRGREIVKERAQELAAKRVFTALRVRRQLGILCATNTQILRDHRMSKAVHVE